MRSRRGCIPRELPRAVAAHRAVIAGSAILFGSTAALAERWTIEPAIGARLTYTTNTNLASSGEENAGFVTTLTPSIAVRGEGARLRLTATAALQGVAYGDQRSSNVIYPQLAANANLELVEQFFFVDASASVSQSFLSPFAPQPTSEANVTGNRYTSQSYRVSPYFQGVAPGNISYLLRNDNTWATFSNTPSGDVGDVGGAGLRSSYVNVLTGRVNNLITRWGWAVDVNRSSTKFTDQQAQIIELARATLYLRPDPQFTLSGSGGYEKTQFPLSGTEGSIYGYGLEWRPTERTNVSWNWEQRFFGPSYRALLSHRTPLTAWSVNASRNITTYPQLLLALPASGSVAQLVDAAFTTRIPDPVERAAAVQQFLLQSGLPSALASPLNFYTQQVTLVQSQSATFAILGVRNSVAFTVFNRKSEPITGSGTPIPAELVPLNNNTQTGGSATYSNRLTSLTSLNVIATQVQTTASAPSTVESKQSYINLVVNSALSPSTNAFAGAGYTTFDSNLANDSNAFNAFVGIAHRF